MATRAPKSLGTEGHFDHYALSALGNLIELVPGPMAQASTFRAFGAAKLSFHTGSTAPGSCIAVPRTLYRQAKSGRRTRGLSVYLSCTTLRCPEFIVATRISLREFRLQMRFNR